MIFESKKDRELRQELKELGRQLKEGPRDKDEDKDMGRQDKDKRWLHREIKWDIKKKVFLGKVNMIGKTKSKNYKGGGTWQRNYHSTI